MHQEHAIPWNTFASHFIFVRDNPRCTPHKTNIFPREPPRPRCKSDLDHFVRVLVDTVRTFARTERAKHPSPNVLASILSPTSKLFDDVLLERYPAYLHAGMQSPTYWVRRAARPPTIPNGPIRYLYTNRRDGDLADALKVLMYATDLRAVLSLVHLRSHKGEAPGNVDRPSVENVGGDHVQVQANIAPGPLKPRLCPLVGLAHLDFQWGPHFGLDSLAESALDVYLYVNLCAALGLLQDGRWLETDHFLCLWRDTTEGTSSNNAHRVVHCAYWAGIGVSAGRNWGIEYDKGRAWTCDDQARTRDYCKELFRIMYVYEMFMAECGIDLDAWWTQTVVLALRKMTAIEMRTMGRGEWALA